MVANETYERLCNELRKLSPDVFIYALKHGCVSERRFSAQALGIVGDRKAMKVLLKVCQKKDVAALEQAIDALGVIGVPEALPVLHDLLFDKDLDLLDSEYLRGLVAISIGSIGSSDSVPYLIGALKDEFSTVRHHAAGALGRMRVSEAIIHLQALLKDKKSGVRWVTARALGVIGCQSSLPPLYALLDSEQDTNVKNITQKAIDTIKANR